MDKLTAKDTKLRESYNERTRRGQAFTADLTQYDEKLRPTIKRAIDNGEINNTRATHAFVEGLAKIEAEKGIGFDFTNNKRLAELGLTVAGRNVGGYVDGTNVTLNLSSSEALNKVVGHEVTHVFEGSGQYDALMAAMKEFAAESGIDWDARVQEMTERYQNVKNADPEKELLADLVGEYLFTDSGFVKSLSTKNPGLFKKIFEEIKYLAKTFAGTKQGAALEKVKNTFAEMYRDVDVKNTAQTDGARYSLLVKDVKGNITAVNPAETTTEQTREYMVKSRKGQLEQYTYFPVSSHTSKTIISTLRNAGIDIADKPLAMQAKKARQSQNDGQHIERDGTVVRHHALTPDEIMEAIEKLEDPIAAIHQQDRVKKKVEDKKVIYVPAPDNFVFFVTLDNGKECAVVIEFDSFIKKESIQKDGHGDDYHTTVTVFEPDQFRDGEEFDYIEYLAVQPSNREMEIKKESPETETAISQTQATVSEKELSNNSIRNPDEKVNGKFSLSGNEQAVVPVEQQNEVYLGAVNRGDMETAQNMVDEAAKAAGYDVKVFHGTDSFGFTKLDVSKSDDGISFFAADRFETASTYTYHDTKKVRRLSGEQDDVSLKSKESFSEEEVRNIANNIAEFMSSEIGIVDYVDGNAIVDANENGISVLNRITKKWMREVYETKYSKERKNGVFKRYKNYEDFELSDKGSELLKKVNAYKRQLLNQFELKYGQSTESSGVYDFYANTENHLIVDCGNSLWNEIESPNLPDTNSKEFEKYKNGNKGHWTTRSVTAYAKDLGYSGVTFKNIKDTGGNGFDKTPATVYAFFNPQEQVKSADPVTYDDDGNVIPLSERFNAENEDIRYSLSGNEQTSAPTGGYRITGEDIALAPTKEDIARMEQERNAAATSEVDDAGEELGAPTREDILQMEMERELYGDWRMTDPLDIKVEKLYRMMLRETISEEEYNAQLVKADRQYQQRGSRVEDALERIREAYSKYKEMPTNEDSTAVNTNPAIHTPEEQAIIEEYQAAVDEELVNYVEKVKANPGAKNGRYTLKNVSDRAAADIKKLTGVDVAGNKTQIEGRIVEHILKRHGENGKADQSMRDVNDIARIQYVLDNYDNAEYSGKSKGYVTVDENGKSRLADTVTFSKKVNGTYYVVEAVPDTKSKTVFVVSARMAKNGQKTTQQPLNPVVQKPPAKNVQDANENTAVVPGTTVPTNTVPQNFDDVKQKAVEAVLGEKGAYVSKQANALYDEVKSMQKGKRVSNTLSYLLDTLDLSEENKAESYNSLRTALLNIRDNPNQVVNPNSAVEAAAREMLDREYDAMAEDFASAEGVAKDIGKRKTKLCLKLYLYIDGFRVIL